MRAVIEMKRDKGNRRKESEGGKGRGERGEREWKENTSMRGRKEKSNKR